MESNNNNNLTMKDACGICSTFLEGEEVVKTTTTKTVTLSEINDILHVESIVGMPSKLDSIVEDVKEERESELEEKKEETDEVIIIEDIADSEPISLDVATTTVVTDVAVAEAAKPSTEIINPVEEIIVVKDSTLECDFDKSPTDLYLCLMRKDWSGAIRRCVQRPDEAKTWIYRKEPAGTLRWKLLPIHAAVIFNAPVPVIDSLLHSFAEGASYKDDQGMVPLHLAIRMNSDHSVVEKLVAAQPESVKAQDRKGRTPRALAEKQAACPQKLLVIQTLENVRDIPRPAQPVSSSKATVGDSVPTVASPKGSLATISMNIPAGNTSSKSESIISTKDIESAKHSHSLQLEKLTRDSAAIQNQLKARIEVLEKAASLDLEKIRHLEESAQTTHETESDLRNKLNEMELSVQNAIQEKVLYEDSNKAVIVNLVSQVGDLQTKLTEMTNEKEALASALADVEEASKQEIAQRKLRCLELERQLGQATFMKKESDDALSKAESTVAVQKGQINLMKEDIAKLQTKLTVTETKLEEVTVSEQELAWQNHALSVTGQMYAKSGQADPTVKSDQIKALEQEREELRETVNKLSVKLYKVVGFLDEMVQEQEAIITETMTRDNELVTATSAGDGTTLLSDPNATLLSSEQKQQQVGVRPSDDRIKLLSNVSGMKEQIIGVIDSVIEGMPQNIDDDVVDQVCTTLKENHRMILP
jgi:hypothetical protein